MAYPILAASSTWYKSNQARSTITQINIVDTYTPTGSENETWNADVDNSGSIKCYRTGTILTIAGNGSGKIAANTNSNYAFSDSSRTNFYSNLTVINGLNILDTSNVVNAEGMFSFFESLNTLDVGNFNTSNITNMTAMFARSPSLENLDVATKIINAGTEDEYIAWDVSNVSSFKAMFQGSSSTEKMKIKSLNVGDWNTSSATNMAHMFYRCGELTSIPLDNWNVSNVTTMSHMFSDCSKLQSINLINWDTSKVTTFDAMFNDCIGLTTIDVSRLKTQACLSFAQMFERCSNLTKLVGLDRWDTAKGTKFDQMFEDCSNLIEIIGLNNWDTGSATDMHKMFRGCKSLTAIDVSSFIVNNPSAVSQMFEGCENVKYLDLSGFKTLGTTYLAYMFTGMNRLEKITLGADFRFDGCDSSIISSAELPTPDPAYITGADGNWYTVSGTPYLPLEIPNKTANTYYASIDIVKNLDVKLKNGTIIDIATQIKEKTGKADNIKPSVMADEIAGIESGGIFTSIEEKDVNFYDYDGTLLYSYTLDEIQALTELPKAPDWHDELVFYGWNWSLETLKSENCPIDVGALYDTNDSKAHLHITIDEFLSKSLSIAMYAAGNTTAYIDWGDGSSVETVSLGTTATMFSHTYSNYENYVIKVWGNSLIYLGYNSGQTNIFGDTTTYSPNCTLLRKMFSGTKCGAGRYAFAYCSALEYVTLNPTWGVSYGMFAQSDNLVCCHMAIQGNIFGYSVFQACNSLRIVAVSENTSYMQTGIFRDCVSLRRIRPKKDVQISEGYVFWYASALQEMRGKLNSGNTSAFQGCYCLRKFVVHENSTGIPASAFNSCYVLQSLDIPASVTSIGAQAFQNCHCMRKIKFNSTTPPTVANSNAFTGVPTDCIVEVPAGTLATYQSATNYGTIAAQMVEV